MNPSDLRRAIAEGNLSEKTYRQSMEIAMRLVAGEDIKMLCPDEKTAKMFLDTVIARIKEMPEELT